MMFFLFVVMGCFQLNLIDFVLQEVDIVVIGGGLMGSSSVWQLVCLGEFVLFFEKQESQYIEGLSLGIVWIVCSFGLFGDVWFYLYNCIVIEVEKFVVYFNE